VAAGLLAVAALLIGGIIFVVRKGAEEDPQEFGRSSTKSLEVAAAKLKKFNKVMPILKITFAYFQVVGGLGFLFSIKFPPIFSTVVSFVGGLVSLDFISFMPVGCLTSASFYNSLLVYTGLPIIIALFLGVWWLLVSRQKLKNAIFETFLAMTFLILPSVSIKIFSTFSCHLFDDGSSNLKVDYNIDCNEKGHRLYELYALFMIFVYPIGIPFMYWFLLYRRRHDLDGGQTEKEKSMSNERALKMALEERRNKEEDDPTLKALSFLYSSYEVRIKATTIVDVHGWSSIAF
jgi:hypothetical protein